MRAPLLGSYPTLSYPVLPCPVAAGHRVPRLMWRAVRALAWLGGWCPGPAPAARRCVSDMRQGWSPPPLCTPRLRLFAPASWQPSVCGSPPTAQARPVRRQRGAPAAQSTATTLPFTHGPAGSRCLRKPAACPQPRRAPCTESAARPRRSQLRRLPAGGRLPALEARRRLQLLPLPLRVRGGHQGGHPGHGEPRRAGAPGAGAAATPASAASLLCFEAATKAAIGGDMDTESRGEQARPAPAPLPPRTAREGPCGCSGSPCGCVSLL